MLEANGVHVTVRTHGVLIQLEEDFHMALKSEILSGPGDCTIDQHVES